MVEVEEEVDSTNSESLTLRQVEVLQVLAVPNALEAVSGEQQTTTHTDVPEEWSTLMQQL